MNRELPKCSWHVPVAAIEPSGHTPGHVSFFRDGDRVPLAGDAFCTVDQTSAVKFLTIKLRFRCLPITSLLIGGAHASVVHLADLDPEVIGAGHGEPMFGDEARYGLRRLAREWPQPKHGRCVSERAVLDETGIVYLPPPAPDSIKGWPERGCDGVSRRRNSAAAEKCSVSPETKRPRSLATFS